MDHEDTRHVADRLAEQATHVDLGTPMVEVVMQRGRQRQQRRRTAVGVMAVASVCAATIVTVNVLTRPVDHRRTVTSPVADDSLPSGVPADVPTGDGIVSTPAQLVDSNLVWNHVDPDSAAAISMFSGDANPRVAGDGPFIAWSTAPGLPDGSSTDYQPMLWRSDDGQSWQPVANPPSTTAAGGVAARDGRFFVYGTTPASAGTGRNTDISISTSDDGGETWSAMQLPIDTTGLAAEPGVAGVSVSATSLAAGPEGILLVARVGITLDTSLLPPDASTYGYNITPTGIEIYGPGDSANATSTTSVGYDGAPVGTAPADTAPVTDGDAVATASTLPAGVNTTVFLAPGSSMTWAELGISDAAVAALNSQRHFYFSADGVTFTEVAGPSVATPVATPGAFWDARLTAIDGGFVASLMTYGAGTGEGSTELFQTSDGQTWTDLGPSPIPSPQSLASMGDRLVMFGVSPGSRNPGTSSIAVRQPDGAWTMIDLNDLTLPTDGVLTSLGSGGLVAGPTGITLLANLYVDPVAEVGGVDVTHDGITMHADDLNGNFTFLDADGNELGRIGNTGTATGQVAMDQQAGEYDVYAPDGGELLTTFNSGEFYDKANAEMPITVPTTFVLHSTDGVNWSRESLSDLAGQPIGGTGGVRVTDTQIIVGANLAGETNANGTPKQTLLIGTPAG